MLRPNYWTKTISDMGTQVRTINAYIARDEDGALYHYSDVPVRGEGVWDITDDIICGELPPKMFPEITWDDAPRKVEIAIKLL